MPPDVRAKLRFLIWWNIWLFVLLCGLAWCARADTVGPSEARCESVKIHEDRDYTLSIYECREVEYTPDWRWDGVRGRRLVPRWGDDDPYENWPDSVVRPHDFDWKTDGLPRLPSDDD